MYSSVAMQEYAYTYESIYIYINGIHLFMYPNIDILRNVYY